MAFKCTNCGIYKGSKARYKGTQVCNDCVTVTKGNVTK